MPPQSLLQRLEQLCNVDVDDVDPALIASLSVQPHNRKFILPDALEESSLTELM